ncbi:MAG: hypothetical protein IAE93_11075 [Ignavibacteria bacterium]|nr:hypothetical protein [Ignavibacteria bacterium]
MTEEFETLSDILMKYQIEGRYPDYKPELPDISKAWEYFNKTIEFKKWLIQKL